MRIPFNKPLKVGKEQLYIRQLLEANKKYSGDGDFTAKCHDQIKALTLAKKVLLTTSCTHALEMSAMLIDIEFGDEVIMPSFTFVSTANPFVLRGAKIVFVDIRPDTMNINESLIEEAITPKTKAIVPVHYGAVGCEMKEIMRIANKHNLWVIEDAAQCIDAYYENRHLGTIGHLGAISFHDTKNIHCGEGGCLLINDPELQNRADIIREKGTNRASFLKGEVDKYTWVDKGSSYLPSELSAAFLLAQLERVKFVTTERRAIWNNYRQALRPLVDGGLIEWQHIPDLCKHNGHIFYVKLKDINQRQQVIERLKETGISAVFHYVPLHSAKSGKLFGTFLAEDVYTTVESERLLRLPMWYGLKDLKSICSEIEICVT